MPFNIGPGELIIVLIIALIVVGPGKLPDVGSALGKSIREFRKAATDVKDATSLEAPAPAPAPCAAVRRAPPHRAPSVPRPPPPSPRPCRPLPRRPAAAARSRRRADRRGRAEPATPSPPPPAGAHGRARRGMACRAHALRRAADPVRLTPTGLDPARDG